MHLEVKMILRILYYISEKACVKRSDYIIIVLQCTYILIYTYFKHTINSI